METAKENFAKALLIWQKIVDELPESDHASHAHYFAAICHQRLGEYIKAIENYKIITTNYSQYTYAWNAQFLIGYLYEKLRDSGSVSMKEADKEIKEAYESVLQKYPNCRAQKAASSRLKHYENTNSGEPK